MSFYLKTLQQLTESGCLDRDAPTLVVAAGEVDADVLRSAGFSNVTLSNLDDRMKPNGFAPFKWERQDAEALTYDDGQFAQVIEHAGLHHCASPHKALCEMYRVASRAIVVFEARDSLLVRLAVSLGLTADYEWEAVAANGGQRGGWRNTGLPNFVYRWTEREVRKTLASYDPSGVVPIEYFYGLRLPTARLGLHATWKRAVSRLAAAPLRIISSIFPKQGNEFAFWVGKPVVKFGRGS